MEQQKRTRQWNITINQEAPAYTSFTNFLSQCKRYAYIVHNKDNEEQPHVHLVVEYQNARTFTAVKKDFEGAHIEPVQSWSASLRYLTHNDNPEKHQYDKEEVKSNFDYLEASSLQAYQVVDANEVCDKIASGEIESLMDFARTYGFQNANIYKGLVKDLLQEAYVSKATGSYDKMLQRQLNERQKAFLSIFSQLGGNDNEDTGRKEI